VAIAAAEPVRARLQERLAAEPGLAAVSGGSERIDVLVVAGGEVPPGPDAPAVLCLTDDPRAASRLAALKLRGWGVLPPAASTAELSAAIRALHQGLVVFGPGLAPAAGPAGDPAGGPAAAHASGAALPRLTPREQEVLALLARGLGNKQIAWELRVTEHTVKYHVSAVYAKLGASSRTEALRRGIESGLLSL
jgi:DNA-binding NarL/FixJ family response regulator